MTEAIFSIAKYSLTVAGIVITGLGLYQKWTFKTDHLFEKYSKLSNFSHELAEKTGDETLHKIAKEYGYAAVTREIKLSHEERRVILQMVNPIAGIESYHKCSPYLKINIINKCFTWKNKRHNNKIYRAVLYTTFLPVYFTGAAMLFSPTFYPLLHHVSGGEFIQSLPALKKLAFFLLLMTYGAFFFFGSLNKISKIAISRNLIKESTSKN
nr:hypothetical protein [Pantoea septica]